MSLSDARLMLDLCSGLGGASEAMRRRGWRVITVDVNPDYEPDILVDVRDYVYQGERPDLVWASPPCNEFSREFLPWLRHGQPPDTSIALACWHIIQVCNPVYYCLENTRGGAHFLMPVLGMPSQVFYPYYLWTDLPPLFPGSAPFPSKMAVGTHGDPRRSIIPFQLSLAVAVAADSQARLI